MFKPKLTELTSTAGELSADKVKDHLGILTEAPISLIVISRDGQVVFANDAATSFLGCEPGGLSGLRLSSIMTGDGHAAMDAYLDELGSGKTRVEASEQCFLDKFGCQVPVLVTGFSISPEAGLEGLIALQLTDIRAQKEAERELAVSEERSKFALESALQGVWDRNLKTGEVYHSDRWYDMRGVSRDCSDEIFTSWIDRVHPADRERAMRISSRRKTGIFDEEILEYREKHPDGHWLWVHSRGRPIEWGPDGKPVRIVGTDTDMTKIRESEAALERLSSRLDMALRTSEIGVWDIDLRTRQIQCDPLTAEMYGWSSGELKRLTAREMLRRLHPGDRHETLGAIRRVLKQRTTAEISYRIMLPDGQIRHISSVLREFEDDDISVRLLGTSRDISDEVTAATDLRKAKLLAESRSEALEKAHAKMEHAALHDALTNLPNRRYLDQFLAESGDQADTLFILHIDVDRFKQINDTLGHDAGDELLVRCADILRGTVRESDIVARVGGDEFVICLTGGSDEARAVRLARRIIDRMSVPFTYQQHECRFGVSIGIASGRGEKDDPKQVLINADNALYRAKQNGRSCHRIFTPAMRQEAVRTKILADEILTGLECGQFFPVYQPQFDAKTGRIAGVEALVRWEHPRDGVLTPNWFIEVAESMNVLTRIDMLVVERAVADFAAWQRQGLDIPKVSVNVSSRRLADGELISHMKGLNFAPGTLSFELLESIFLDESDTGVAENIVKAKEMGIDIEIDDFGTGHASIVGLLKIEPKRLKIDRQLVSPVCRGTGACRLVQSIIEIGHSLGIEVVAEGVETAEQVKVLSELGCDTLQGFYFSPPVDNASLIASLSPKARRSTG